jgi:UDP-GlcNAc:undecaprenyl-phosphate GlcNAc-1-phosphate transferase
VHANTIVIHAALAFFGTISLIVLLRNTARRMGLVDRPHGRKQHEGAIPVVGGIAIYGAFAFSALLVTESQSLYPFRSLFGGMALLVVAGVLDDMQDLSAFAKLVLQCAAALLMASWGGVYVVQLGDLFGLGGSLALGNFAIPFTVVCVLGLINALNMTDGVDGLAGGLSFISLSAFAACCYALKLPSHLLIISILIGAVAGFLCFNFRHPMRARANVFLGDAGSMALGFGLCWFAVSLTRAPDSAMPPIVMVWLVGVPLLDMGVVILRRAISGRSPLVADREHLHHLLLRAGLSHGATTWALTVTASVMSGIGLAIWKYQIPSAFGFYGFAGLVVATVAVAQLVSGRLTRAKAVEMPVAGMEVVNDGDAAAQERGVVVLREIEAREIRKR